MLLTGKSYGKTVKGDGNVGLLLGSLYLKFWQIKWFTQQAVGRWQSQDDCYDLISSLASCLPAQPASCAGREFNVSSHSLQALVKFKGFKKVPYIYSFHSCM